ncbi:MAG: hypothetical protein KY393_09410, partial [Actinobacteria bacterium]|nr:hypothetical protein [Actinomycetota bacterium]
CRSGPDIEVVPSANARTVFVKAIDGVSVPAHFLKLHYPKRISRFTRRLRRPIVGLQLWVSDELARIAVNYLPEVGAGVFGTDPRHAWGYVVRDTAAARGDTPGYTVPLFALYGRDLYAAKDPPLLTQLVEASGQRPVDYLTQRIVEPMISLWVDSVLRTGCALELHGQNTLFHFSLDNDVTAIGYRDCAVYVDHSIRQELGLDTPLPPVNVIGRDILHAREQVFSLTYDSFMGHHALAYIAGLAYREWGTQPRTLQDAARKRFRRLSDGWPLLPATVYYYDGALHPDGKWNLVDTGSSPLWR